MGRHGLRKVHILFGVSVCLFLLAATVAATTDNPSLSTATNLHTPKLTMTPMSRQPKLLNISQTEYETKHRMYFDLVEQNQRIRLNATGSAAVKDQQEAVRRRLYRFTHSGLENSRKLTVNPISRRLQLSYHLRIPSESNLTESVLEEASLRMLLVPRRCTSSPLTMVAKADLNTQQHLATTTFSFDACRPQWTELNVLNGFNDRNERMDVTLHCDGCAVNDVEVVDPVLNVIVAVHSRHNRHSSHSRTRSRRATAKRKRKEKCAKHDLEVDFGQLHGYEFIIQPRKHNIGMCKGRCNRKDPDTQHSAIMSQLSRMGHQVPKPCCTPSKMEDLEILYADDEDPSKLQITTWKKTTVLECSCT